MKVLVACEFSGIVRDAFRRRGHDAWSCDVIETEAPGPHLHFDVRLFLGEHWDLMIAFPPCTFICNSGVRWLKNNPQRQHERKLAIEFAKALWDAPIYRIAIENPVGALSSAIRKPDQIIQPWQFGHGETKATCLWLKNLPPLKPTNIVDGREPRVHWAAPGKNRWRERSRTFQGIADAMAAQWG